MIQWQEQTPAARTRELRHWRNPVDLDDGPNDGEPSIVLRANCKRQVVTHLEKRAEEQGGLLLGYAFHADSAPDRPVVIDVVDAVAAPSGHGTAVSLSMGTDLWDSARSRANEIDASHAGSQGSDDALCMIVGWYHSHPGLGAFFSGTDRSTQASFFREPWHLGLVVDPHRDDWAWFRSGDSVDVSPARIIMR